MTKEQIETYRQMWLSEQIPIENMVVILKENSDLEKYMGLLVKVKEKADNEIGFLFQSPDGGLKALEDFIEVRIKLSCGKEVIYPNTGEIPKVDTPCPCGDPTHWIVRFSK